MTPLSRRTFLLSAALLAARTLRAEPLRAGPTPHPTPHPTPRPGITGAKVLTREQLGDAKGLAPLFDSVRAIPEVFDGIRCNCGCAENPGYYSLLSCFEGEAMARHCGVCQGQARLIVRLHKEGKTLDEIRAAVDAKFG